MNFAIRQALSTSTTRATRRPTRRSSATAPTATTPPSQCPGNRRWIQLVYDAYLLMPVGPSDARGARRVPRRRPDALERPTRTGRRIRTSSGSSSRGTASARARLRRTRSRTTTTRDPMPGLRVAARRTRRRSPSRQSHRTRQHAGRERADLRRPVRGAGLARRRHRTRRRCHRHRGRTNLDDTAAFVPGTYEFVASASGYGHLRLPPHVRGGPARRR